MQAACPTFLAPTFPTGHTSHSTAGRYLQHPLLLTVSPLNLITLQKIFSLLLCMVSWQLHEYNTNIIFILRQFLCNGSYKKKYAESRFSLRFCFIVGSGGRVGHLINYHWPLLDKILDWWSDPQGNFIFLFSHLRGNTIILFTKQYPVDDVLWTCISTEHTLGLQVSLKKSLEITLRLRILAVIFNYALHRTL